MSLEDPVLPVLTIPGGPPGLPGGDGDDGAPGGSGAAGKNAYSATTAQFTVPNPAATVTVSVADSDWAAIGLAVYIANAGYFKVTGIPGATSLVVQNLGLSGNASSGTVVSSGVRVVPAGYAVVDSSALSDLDDRVTSIEGGLVSATGNRVYYGAAAPTGAGLKSGDLWFDSDDGFRIYRHDGSGWVDVQRVLDSGDFGTGIRPVQVVASLPPSGNSEGDLAFLTTDKKLYRFNGTSWVSTVAAGDVTGQIGNSQLAANSVAAGQIQAGAITAAHVGTNLLITDAANIGDAVITSAKIASLDAGKITAGDIQSVNIGYAGKIFHPSYSSRKFRAIELGAASNASYSWGTGTSFSFTSHSGLVAYCPGNANWGSGGAPTICPDSDGNARVQLQGRLIGHPGLITVYYRKNGTGGYVALAGRSSTDGNDAIIDTTRMITGLAMTDKLEFFVAPCSADGNIGASVTCRYELDLVCFNW